MNCGRILCFEIVYSSLLNLLVMDRRLYLYVNCYHWSLVCCVGYCIISVLVVVCMPFLVICKNDQGAFLQVLVRIDRGGQCDTDTWKLQERIVRGLTNNFGGLVTTVGLQCDYNCNRTWSWYKPEHGVIVFCMFYPVDRITELTRLVSPFYNRFQQGIFS